jgi:hypothetical protein
MMNMPLVQHTEYSMTSLSLNFARVLIMGKSDTVVIV